MNTELPYLGAGTLTIVGGAIREGKWPSNTLAAIVATLGLVVVASLSDNTKLAPLVKAIGVLFFIAAGMAAITAAKNKKKKGK